MATDLACNDVGGDELAAHSTRSCVPPPRRKLLRDIRRQAKPVIMNTRGVSAAGKSTMRPEQKILAQRIRRGLERLRADQSDIWRKQLLDYALSARLQIRRRLFGDDLHHQPETQPPHGAQAQAR